MDLSRYASRLKSAQQNGTSATRIVFKRDDDAITQAGPRIGSKIGPNSIRCSRLPAEPEDANLTGGTRSLSRRLLALNLTGSIVRSAAPSKSNAA